jgi:hypothetical protein
MRRVRDQLVLDLIVGTKAPFSRFWLWFCSFGLAEGQRAIAAQASEFFGCSMEKVNR